MKKKQSWQPIHPFSFLLHYNHSCFLTTLRMKITVKTALITQLMLLAVRVVKRLARMILWPEMIKQKVMLIKRKKAQ
jgi:hypothetical protein